MESNLANPDVVNEKDLHETTLIFIADVFFQLKEFRKSEVKFPGAI